MSATRAPTKQEIQAAFDEVMDTLHRGVPTDCGFDAQVTAALWAASLQPDNEDLASRARVELKKQLDGTHAKQDDNDWDAAIKAVHR